MCITASQIQWTQDVTKALGLIKERGDQKALKSLKKKQIAMLNKFSEAIRGTLTKQQRLKIVALVTIEVHARDIIEKLIKTKVSDSSAFEWLSQLRLYWERVSDYDYSFFFQKYYFKYEPNQNQTFFKYQANVH